MDMDAADAIRAQRLDKWLVYSRFARTRTVAARLVDGGGVRINGAKVRKADASVRQGDILTLNLPHALMVVEVIGFATRRGPASDMHLLYRVRDDAA